MYIPKYFQITDVNQIHSFIESHPFATVITSGAEQKPVATHVPVNITKNDDTLYISSHVSKANEQWKLLDDKENVLVIFQGPHGYITPTWYQEENVPTWNYQSVHIYGTSHLLSEDELIDDLKYLLDTYEKSSQVHNSV